MFSTLFEEYVSGKYSFDGLLIVFFPDGCQDPQPPKVRNDVVYSPN